MPGINLTRDEAGERARILDVSSYDVTLDLTTSDVTFGSTTTITFSCREPGASTFADLVGATVHEIELNGRRLDASAYVDSRIALDELQAENTLTVTADCAYSRTGEGLHRFVDPVDKLVYLYTQFEVPDARRVFTTFEQPDLKAEFTFHVTAPSQWQVVSNSLTPAPVDLGLGRSVWHFPATHRMSTYITALIAGDYAVVRDTYHGSHGDIELGIFLRESLVQYLDAEDIFTVTKQGFDFFETAFKMAYPFGTKYDQLFVPEYNMGAMENAAAVTFRDDMIYRSRQTRSAYENRANTILHEMAHMWFGDLVTMKWWDDLWLNESFAEWASHHAATVATEYDEAWTSFCNGRKTWAYRQDQLPSTHPVAADNYDLEAVEVNFDGITYAKGASALRQLVAWVGEEHFFEGLRRYFDAHAYGNSEFTDLLGSLELVSGRELGSWAKEWLQTSGVNTVRPVFEVTDGLFTRFSVEQTAHPDFPTIRRHRLAIGLYDLADGTLRLRSRVEIDVNGDETDVPELVGERQPDLVLLNDGDLTYAKVRLDERSLATLVAHIDAFEDSLARALCWNAAWDMTRDAEMRASDWVDLVLRGIELETDLTAVRMLVNSTGRVASSYTAPEHREAVATRWESGLRELALRAQAGSDSQLTFVRAFAGAAHADDSLDLIEGLLDGSRTLEGLAVDVDLRWTLLTSLATQGRAGSDAIDAELDRDNTISGQENSAAARAARPTAEAKADAWHDAVERDDVPNETMRSIAYAFQQANQDEILRPYVDRYLEAASTIWEERGVNQASTVLEVMFPRELATQSTLDAVDAWLESATPNPAARRYVLEGRADIERALKAQAKDAQP